jgi:phosphoribosylformylglycinamidine synthase
VVGLVGELPDASKAGGIALRNDDAIALVGPFAPSLAGSELAKQRGELGPGLPGVDLAAQVAALAFVRDAIRAERVTGAHDVSDGGVACALAEMAIAGGVGAECDLDPLVEERGSSGETAVFGEGPGGYLLAGSPDDLERLAQEAETAGVDAWVVGRAGGDRVALSAAELELALALDTAERSWRSLSERFAV